jgi:hypothetical protein
MIVRATKCSNPFNRFAVNDWILFKYGPGSSLEFYFENGSAGAGKEANRLPAPKEPFNLIMSTLHKRAMR